MVIVCIHIFVGEQANVNNCCAIGYNSDGMYCVGVYESQIPKHTNIRIARMSKFIQYNGAH